MLRKGRNAVDYSFKEGKNGKFFPMLRVGSVWMCLDMDMRSEERAVRYAHNRGLEVEHLMRDHLRSCGWSIDADFKP